MATAEKITSTGVVEKLIGENGKARYIVRFTGAQNRSFLAKTAQYTGPVEKYPEGKLVHIRYWFDKKGRPGLEIIDPELEQVPQNSARLRLCCWLLGIALLAAGIVLLVV